MGLLGCSAAVNSSTQTPATSEARSASDTPRATAVSTPAQTSSAGIGRKDAAMAHLPDASGGYHAMGGVMEATMSSSALYVARADDSVQVLAVLVRRPSVDVNEITKGLRPHTYGMAKCGATPEGHFCYLQLLGGFLNLTAPDSVPVDQLAALAGELYDGF